MILQTALSEVRTCYIILQTALSEVRTCYMILQTALSEVRNMLHDITDISK